MSKNDKGFLNTYERRMRERAARRAEVAETVRALLRPAEETQADFFTDEEKTRMHELVDKFD